VRRDDELKPTIPENLPDLLNKTTWQRPHEHRQTTPAPSQSANPSWFSGHSIHSIHITARAAVPFNGFYPKCGVLHGFRFLTFIALRIKPSSLPLALCCGPWRSVPSESFLQDALSQSIHPLLALAILLCRRSPWPIQARPEH